MTCWFLDDVFLRTEGSQSSILYDAYQIAGIERTGAMRYDNGYAAASANTGYRSAQCFIALRVEIRIRFVQNDNEGIVIKRTRQRNALALARR